MNREQYNSDTRYEKVLHNMDLLGIMDITTTRQHKNGTIVWRLPIKNHDNRNLSYIEVASFKTGYVRNQNSGYSNYQLNKRCEGEPEYFELPNGDYRKFTTRSCVLIPIEIDRLEYLISYCLKNYYIKRANQVVEGKYVSQWYHDWSLERANETYSENTGAMARIELLQSDVDEHVNTIIKLEEKLVDMTEARDYYLNKAHSLENKLSNAISPTKHQCTINKLHDLENKLATINRISE